MEKGGATIARRGEEEVRGGEGGKEGRGGKEGGVGGGDKVL